MRSCACLSIKKRSLPFDTPAITGKRTVTSYNPVAWDGKCQSVRTASLGHGPYRLGHANLLSDRRIAYSCAHRNLAQRLPHALLKRRTSNIQRQGKPEGRAFDEARHFRGQLFAVTIF